MIWQSEFQDTTTPMMQGPVYFLGYIMEGSVTHTFLAKAWVSMCVGHYEFKPLICKKLLEKKNAYILPVEWTLHKKPK